METNVRFYFGKLVIKRILSCGLGNCVSDWHVLIFQYHIPEDSILHGNYNKIFLYQKAVLQTLLLWKRRELIPAK